MGFSDHLRKITDGGEQTDGGDHRAHYECRACGRNLDAGQEVCPACGGDLAVFEL